MTKTLKKSNKKIILVENKIVGRWHMSPWERWHMSYSKVWARRGFAPHHSKKKSMSKNFAYYFCQKNNNFSYCNSTWLFFRCHIGCALSSVWLAVHFSFRSYQCHFCNHIATRYWIYIPTQKFSLFINPRFPYSAIHTFMRLLFLSFKHSLISFFHYINPTTVFPS